MMDCESKRDMDTVLSLLQVHAMVPRQLSVDSGPSDLAMLSYTAAGAATACVVIGSINLAAKVLGAYMDIGSNSCEEASPLVGAPQDKRMLGQKSS